MAIKKEELQRKRRYAYMLYVDQGLEQKIISEIIGVSENTISKWKSADNWEEDRQFTNIAPDKIMKRVMRQYDTLLKQIEERDAPKNVPDSKEADILNKLADSVKKLQTEVLFGHKTEVGKQFISYVQKTYGQARAIEVMNLWHEFLMSNQ
jgi:transposase